MPLNMFLSDLDDDLGGLKSSFNSWVVLKKKIKQMDTISNINL